MGLPDSGPMATSRLSGTVWQGRMQIDGGHAVTWNARPGASLLALGFAADWQATGPGTDLGGRAAIWRGGLDLAELSGVAGWPLVAAALPGLPIACTAQARFAAVAVRLGGAEPAGSGTVTTSAGDCARTGGQAVPAPAIHAQISTLPDAVQVLVTPQEGPRVPLVTARLTNEDRLIVTIHKAGAILVPGMPNTADSELDLPLSVLMGG